MFNFTPDRFYRAIIRIFIQIFDLSINVIKITLADIACTVQWNIPKQFLFSGTQIDIHIFMFLYHQRNAYPENKRSTIIQWICAAFVLSICSFLGLTTNPAKILKIIVSNFPLSADYCNLSTIFKPSRINTFLFTFTWLVKTGSVYWDNPPQHNLLSKNLLFRQIQVLKEYRWRLRSVETFSVNSDLITPVR